MNNIKAGYVSFGTMFYEPATLKMISSRAEKQLKEAGLELITTDPVFGEGPEPARAIRELKATFLEGGFFTNNLILKADTN